MTARILAFVQTLLLGGLALVMTAGMLSASDKAPVERLMQALHFDEVTAVLADEGRSLSDGVSVQDLGVPRAAFEDMLSKLYDEEHMLEAFRQELTLALEGTDVAPMVRFFESDLGQKISTYELDARKALSSDEALEAAKHAWASLDPEDPRAKLIEAYVTTNDLVEMNVVGAMNSDLAYYQGLWQFVDNPEEKISDDELLRSIWSSEPEVRADVAEWVYGFSVVAYDRLSDGEFSKYLEFARSDAGQQLNFALFAAFDAAYDDISRGLGAGTGALLQVYNGQEL